MTALTAGSPEYLGARIDGAGVNFCLFSAHAERVVLCVFDEQGGEQQWELPGRSGDRWHGHLAGAGAGLRYGFRLHGPFDPGEGHRFNPAKLVIDPCAYALEGEVGDHPALLDAGDRPDPTDSAPYVPKCRTPAFSADAPLFAAIKADPLLGRCKLIAEPWDIGPDGYQAGRSRGTFRGSVPHHRFCFVQLPEFRHPAHRRDYPISIPYAGTAYPARLVVPQCRNGRIC